MSPLRWFTRATGMPRDVLILSINAFFVAVGFGVLMPVLPIVAREFGVTVFMTTWLISSFALMRLAISPFCGRIVDALGERAALALGIGVVAMTSVFAGLSTTFWQLLIFRAAGGLGSAVFTVASMTLLLRTAPPSMRGRASSYFQGGFLLGGMAGPAVGGLVMAISTRAPFFMYAATLAIGGTICLVFLRKTPPRDDVVTASPTKSMADVLRDVRYQAALFSGFATGWGAMGVRMVFVPLLITETLKLPREYTGYLFAVAAVAQTVMIAPAGRWTDSIGRRPVLVGSLFLTAVAIALTPLAPSVWVLGAFMVLTGIAGAGVGPAQSAVVGDATEGKGGTPIAVYSMSTDIGVIVGPLVAGVLADHFGLGSAFYLAAAILLASALFALRMPKGRPADVTLR